MFSLIHSKICVFEKVGVTFLSPVRLPVSPPRRKISDPIVSTIYAVFCLASAFACARLSPRIVPIALARATIAGDDMDPRHCCANRVRRID